MRDPSFIYLPDDVIVEVRQVTSEVSSISPDDVIVEVRQVMSEVNPASPDDVIVEVRQVMSKSILFHLMTS
jgi:hypothetical protein